MIKSRKQMFIIMGAFILVLMLFTTTYAFFNYTRTGSANTIRTGRIAFNSTQGNTINLTNMFPIDTTVSGIMNDSTKVGTVTINVTGDTTYAEGLEYLVTATNVTNTVGNKSLPISINVSVANNTNNDPATTLGISNNNYFNDRGSTASYYKVLAGDTINSDDQLVVGYIAPGTTGVDGNIVIRAYLDSSKIAISDTYDESDPGTDNMGTTTEWVDDRTIFTTTEWNALQTNGVSFQIKVESNEGVWVRNPHPTATFDVGSVVNTKIKTVCGVAQNSNCLASPILANELPDMTNFNENNIISLSTSESKIYVWISGEYNENLNFYTDAETIYLNQDSSYMFHKVYEMRVFDLSIFDASNVINMSHMFEGSAVNYSTIANWNVSSVTDMSSMFNNSFDIDNFQPYFGDADASPINNWDVSNVTNFDNMFAIDAQYSSVLSPSDRTFPIFTTRPGTWDNSMVQINNKDYYAGTYVPNN